jgi:hypothetical protein
MRSHSSRPLTAAALLFTFLCPGCSEGPNPGTASAGSAGNAAGGGAGQAGSAAGTPARGAASGGAASGGASGSASGGSTSGSGGRAGSGGSSGGTASGCNGAVTVNLNPFGCDFAWGANADSGQQRASYAGYMHFVSSWILEGEPGLAAAIANTDAIPVYYGYIIGSRLPDCNVNPNPPNLCTHGAQMIRENWNDLVDAYANAAAASERANNGKIAVWLLEGDFIQYYEDSQTMPLSFQELGRLTEDITCAIKTNQPMAVVAVNHTTWNGDDETDDFWGAMPLALLDMVWTTGVGNNNGYISSDGGPGQYNARTARYQYLSNLTGKKIFVDESFGGSRMSDTWLNQPANTINQRIAEGVIAVNLTGTGLPGSLAGAVANLSSQLNGTCQ